MKTISKLLQMDTRLKGGLLSLLLLIGILPFVVSTQLHGVHSNAAGGTIYYVSPSGNDNNPGTQSQPWQTLHKAASVVGPGDTAIFTDGTYTEDAKVYFRAVGTADAPILFKSQNKWGAKMVFTSGTNGVPRFYVTGSYTTFDGFDVSSTVYTPGESYDNGFRFWAGADHDTLINCKINNVMIAAKSNADYTLFANNIVGTPTTPSPGALEFFGNFGGVMRDNLVYYASNYAGALNAKGGARSVQMYNNEIHILGPSYLGIDLGGFSDGTSPPYDRAGWENYNSVAFNNVVIVDSGGQLYGGIGTSGGKDVALYNNVVIGADRGLYTDFGGEDKGPGNWYNTTPGNRNGDPPVVNATFENNIVINSVKYATEYLGLETGTTPVTDYNNFYNNASATPTQVHPIIGNPLFVSTTSDWHLQSTSPAIKKGLTINGFTGYNGENISVSFDKNNWTRTTPWDLGIYESDGIPPSTATPTSQATPTVTPASATATPLPTQTQAALPSPWQASAIGTKTISGNTASASNGVFSLTDAGNDIWGTADSFEYVYQLLSGDGTIIAQVATLGSSNSWAKAGVMLRQDTTAGSSNVFVGLSGSNGATFQARTSNGASTQYGITNPPQPERVPYWVKLTRSGTTVTGYISSDGATWQQWGSVTLSMQSPVLIGLATTSHDSSILNTATFSNVSVSTSVLATPTSQPPTPTSTPVPIATATPTPTPTQVPTDLTPPAVTITSPANGATLRRGSTITITASASDNVGVTQVVFLVNGSTICTDTTTPYTCSWSVGGKPNATYVITAQAYDAFGNTSSNAIKVYSSR